MVSRGRVITRVILAIFYGLTTFLAATLIACTKHSYAAIHRRVASVTFTLPPWHLGILYMIAHTCVIHNDLKAHIMNLFHISINNTAVSVIRWWKVVTAFDYLSEAHAGDLTPPSFYPLFILAFTICLKFMFWHFWPPIAIKLARICMCTRLMRHRIYPHVSGAPERAANRQSG